MLESAQTPVRRKRLRKDPLPRFKRDVSHQIDLVFGCPEQALPNDHLARKLRTLLTQLDFSALEAKYSSQGRRGFHPRHVIGVLVYGSLIGVHHSTKLERLLRTDMACRYMAGGHVISAGVLRRVRRDNRDFFDGAITQTLRLAAEADLLDPEEIAVDSVKLRAHASTKAARTLKRSRQRLAELAERDLSVMTVEQLEEHRAKVAKHSAAVAMCQELERTNLVLTSPSAALLKFPSGASAPGHRVTVTATGVKERFVIGVLIDAASCDYGKLAPALLNARAKLKEAGVPLDQRMQAAADAGYFSETDLMFAAENRSWIDVLIDESSTARSGRGSAIMPQTAFERRGDSMICPAGREMDGPWSDRPGKTRWEGRGCSECALKPQCTTAAKRVITFKNSFHATRQQMRERMAQDGARKRYNKRIATIEPVFSYIEDTMAFRRVTTRKAEAAEAEILLKVFAYNLSRLLVARRLRRVFMLTA
jgi:transposase